MKTSKYKLTVHYENGDSATQGGLTQTRCYEILKKHQANGWRMGDMYIDTWEISTGKKEIEF